MDVSRVPITMRAQLRDGGQQDGVQAPEAEEAGIAVGGCEPPGPVVNSDLEAVEVVEV